MPSSMMHLLLAKKIHNSYPIEFFIGSIAPDAIAIRENYTFADKNKLHFRNSNIRLDDIYNLAKTVDMNDPFQEGYILHLFFDAYWDNDCIMKYIRDFGEDGWFRRYRNEISRAGSWIYHNDAEIAEIWDNMFAFNKTIEKIVQGITQDEITGFINRNYAWHRDNKLEPSSAFTPVFIIDYIDMIKDKYLDFKDKVLVDN